MSILWEVEQHLKRHQRNAHKFGVAAVRDPRLVYDMRKGREPQARTITRIRDEIQRFETAHGA